MCAKLVGGRAGGSWYTRGLLTTLDREPTVTQRAGVVAIGRNEGERFRRCLDSLAGRADAVVYVDSGSTDGSVELARERGATVVALDASRPFTAARARNAGYDKLKELAPDLEFVQFVDGDCQFADGWLELAAATLRDRPEVAVVCGRRREIQPEASVYNRLCDLEWDTPVGEARACGGDAMMRGAVFESAGKFDPALIAGEEPELCVRIRGLGFKILRLDAEMTRHDAAMTRFGQWWKRNVRAGHAFAEGAHLHGAPPERHWVREVRSNWFWGLVVPFLAVAPAWPTYGLSLGLLLGYPVLAYRIYNHRRRLGTPAADARRYAGFCALGKFPQCLGQWKFVAGRLLGRKERLIEYKDAPTRRPS